MIARIASFKSVCYALASLCAVSVALAQPEPVTDPAAPATTATAAPEPTAPEVTAAPAAVPPPTATVAPEPPPPEPPPTAAVPPEPPPAAPPPPEPAPAPAPGPEFLPLSVSGSFWSRYELREGYAEHGLAHPRLHREGDYIVSRARLGLKTNPVAVSESTKVSATFVPQAAYTFGTTGAPVTIADSPAIVLYEGYASVGNGTASFDAGRFAMDYGDALVIGNLGWNEAARAFNGARLRLTPTSTPMFVDAFATLILEGRGTTLEPVSGDTYFYGLYADVGPLIAEKFALDIYLLGQTLASYEVADAMDPTVTLTRDTASEFTLGSRVKGEVAIVDYRVEAGVQFGKTTGEPTAMAPAPEPADKTAFQVDGELGVAPVKGLRISAGGFMASGDDLGTPENEGWNELYPTGHKWLGLTDVTGARTNIAGARGGVKYGLDWLVASVDFHSFSRLEQDASGEDGSMGSELDFNLIHPIGKGAAVRAMYGVFLPTEEFWEPKVAMENAGAAGDPIHFLEVQFGYDFK